MGRPRLRAPTIEPPTSTREPAERRRSRRWVWILASVMAIALVAAITYLTNYQPLVRGSFEGHSDTTYRQGATFSYAISLRNDGNLPITVSAVDARTRAGLLRVTGVYEQRMTPFPKELGYDRNLYQPFQPFTLG